MVRCKQSRLGVLRTYRCNAGGGGILETPVYRVKSAPGTHVKRWAPTSNIKPQVLRDVTGERSYGVFRRCGCRSHGGCLHMVFTPSSWHVPLNTAGALPPNVKEPPMAKFDSTYMSTAVLRASLCMYVVYITDTFGSKTPTSILLYASYNLRSKTLNARGWFNSTPRLEHTTRMLRPGFHKTHWL